MKRLTVVALAGSVVLAGCVMAGSIFNTEPFVDAKKDANGKVILLDTPRMWRDWTQGVDRGIADESVGKRPPAGAKTWNESWLRAIAANQKARENAPKYIAYIVEQRRKAGLPELAGYP